jgi:hypothetical protein
MEFISMVSCSSYYNHAITIKLSFYYLIMTMIPINKFTPFGNVPFFKEVKLNDIVSQSCH